MFDQPFDVNVHFVKTTTTETKRDYVDPTQPNIFFCTLLHMLTACGRTVTHLYKHSKVELRAELLDSLGQSLLVITVWCLFLNFFCGQPQTRPALCMQTLHGQKHMRKMKRKININRHTRVIKNSRSTKSQEPEKQCIKSTWDQSLLCFYSTFFFCVINKTTAALFETNRTLCYLFKCVCVCFCVSKSNFRREGTHSVRKPAAGGQWCQRSVWWVTWSECREEHWGHSA